MARITSPHSGDVATAFTTAKGTERVVTAVNQSQIVDTSNEDISSRP